MKAMSGDERRTFLSRLPGFPRTGSPAPAAGDTLKNLADAEKQLERHWGEVLAILRKDSANIWMDDVQRKLQTIQSDAGQIGYFILLAYRRKANHSSEDEEFIRQERKKIRELVYLLNSKTGQAKKEWVARVHADILFLIKDADALQKRTPPDSEEKIAELRRWQFPYYHHPNLTAFLIAHWDDVERMVAALNRRKGSWLLDVPGLFQWGLPALKPFITERTWPTIVEGLIKISTACGDRAIYVFQGMPAIVHFANKRTWPTIVDGLITMAIIPRYNVPTLFQNLPRMGDIINHQTWPLLVDGLPKLVDGHMHDVGPLFQYSLPAVRHLINERTWPIILAELPKRSLPAIRNAPEVFRDSLQDIIRLSKTMEDFFEICDFLSKLGFLDLVKRDFLLLCLRKARIKEELFREYRKLEGMERSQLYHTVQGLNSLGFLCCHVTNAFFGGAAGSGELKRDPFQNILADATNKYDYNPSASVIIPHGKSSIVVTSRDEIKGSVGVIYDYGYLYESYVQDASTKDKGKNGMGATYRTGDYRYKQDPHVVFVYSENFGAVSRQSYNEVLLRKWTVSALFYTKGCQPEAISRLKSMSKELSFREHINGAYWYRTTKSGVPERIIKAFPVFEIDTSTNTWTQVYMPSKLGYRVMKEAANNRWLAVPLWQRGRRQ